MQLYLLRIYSLGMTTSSQLSRATFSDNGRAGTAELDDGREVALLVDADLSGKGARFVTFDACDQRDAAWVRANEGALLEAFDAHQAREVWL